MHSGLSWMFFCGYVLGVCLTNPPLILPYQGGRNRRTALYSYELDGLYNDYGQIINLSLRLDFEYLENV